MRNTLLLWLTVPGLCVSAAPAQPAPSAPDPARAMSDFLKAYWDPDRGLFLAWNRSAPFARPSGAGPGGGKYSDFWWAAQLWDLVLDAAARDPDNAADRALIAQVYDGFQAAYPEWQNDFNDDLGWWAQAATRAAALTHDARYQQRAEALFTDIWRSWTPDLGGGVLWRRSGGTQKNVATNAPLVVTAVRLYQATNDPVYLERARQLYTFVDTRLTDGDARVYDNIEGGELRRWDFTYNVGNFVLASLALREVTTDPAERAHLLTRAVKSADWALANLTNAGIFLDEGSGDGGGFKGVLMRGLAALTREPDLNPGSRARYTDSLRENATQVWNQRRPSDGLVGPDWSSPAGDGVIESMTAASAVAALLLAPPPLPGGPVTGNGRYEAENSLREHVNTSVAAPGFTGRGYVNAFVQDGGFVEFRVNVASAGPYTARLHYSAGAGAAVRSVSVNGADARPVTLPATPDWQTWADQDVPLTLPAGASRVRLSFNRLSGDRNWLNLDHLTLGSRP
ncbi:glycoside hydrolase family 76 protein [Deinococcus sonorensis]|uniref:Glycoside hydrolase family 76 protein n=2 Tax=Deinococcus sonorensis TaxID=309891 RepID=A0AAU7U5A9_9DEIO